MKYDDASWHYAGNYPKNLPKENAATHIGMFLTWMIDNDMVSQMLLDDFSADLIKVKEGHLTGAEFLMNNCDEKFTDEDLNDEGNAFARDYYEQNTQFSKVCSNYFIDYWRLFEYIALQNNFKYESIYHVENSWENYEELRLGIDRRYEEWKQFRNSQKM